MMIKVKLAPDETGFQTEIWINAKEVRAVAPCNNNGMPIIGECMVYIPGCPSPLRVQESPLSLVERIEHETRTADWMRLPPGPTH